MPTIYNRTSGNTSLILGPFESLSYPFNFGSYKEIRMGCGLSAVSSTGTFLKAPYSEEVIPGSSNPLAYFYFGVKPFSNLMPHQETGLGFIGTMNGYDLGRYCQIFLSSGPGSRSGQCANVNLSNSSDVVGSYGHFFTGILVNNLETTDNNFYFNVVQQNLDQGKGALNGFSFVINSIGTTSQNYSFTQFDGGANGQAFSINSNMNALISGLNAKLDGAFSSSLTGFLGSNGSSKTGLPLALPNSFFIYNPFSSISLVIENLTIVKYS